jgi:NAD(P)H-dependent FMN reductase
MPTIAIISASVRNDRNSHRAALYFQNFLAKKNLASVLMLDLRDYDFPVFHERLKYLTDPPPRVLDFVEQIKKANGVIIVTPEYNGGYPASLKNVIDLLYEDWYKKPISVVTVSDGSFGGTQVITSLLFTLWKIKAWVIPPAFPVPKVEEMFNEQGEPKDATTTDKRAQIFINELFWSIAAKEKMEQSVK